MNPHTREQRLTRAALRAHFPQASDKAITRAALAAGYGATPAQVASILRADAKERAITLEVKL